MATIQISFLKGQGFLRAQSYKLQTHSSKGSQSHKSPNKGHGKAIPEVPKMWKKLKEFLKEKYIPGPGFKATPSESS